MKYFLIILLFAFSFSANAGELIISPKKPQTGTLVKVKYKADERFIDTKNLKLKTYSFSSQKASPKAEEFALIGSGNELSTSFRLSSETVFVLMKVDGEDSYFDIYDDNKGNFWDLIVYNKAGKAIRNGHMLAGISYMASYPDSYKRLPDFKKAKKHLRKEVKNYPKNIQAQIGLTSLLYDNKKLTKDEYEKQLYKYAQGNSFKNESEAKAKISALMTLNRENEANEIKKSFIKKYPQSDFAEEKDMELIKNSKTFTQFVTNTKKYLNKFRDASNKEIVLNALVNSYLQMAKYDELIKELASISNVPLSVYNQLALQVLQKEDAFPGKSKAERLELAKKLIQEKTLDYVDGTKNFSILDKPDYLTESEWETDRNVVRANIAVTAAEIYKESGEFDKSLKYYEKAFNYIQYRADLNLYERVSEYCLVNSKYPKALDLSTKAILSSNFSEDIERIFKKSLKEVHPENYLNHQSILDSLYIIAEKRRVMKLDFYNLDKEFSSNSFSTLDGKVYDFTDLEDKVVVMLFWSTWCEPCNAVYPVFEEKFYEYQANDDIVIVAMNIWERANDRESEIYKFLNTNKYEFPVFLDNYDMIPKQIGLLGLPAMVFWDKEGKIQFIETGFKNENLLRMEIDDKINYLMEKE